MTHGSNKGVEYHNTETRRAYKRDPEFRGVDGEGGNVAEEGTLFGVRHQYLSLRSGPDLLETGKPLSWDECFSFLANQPSGLIHVAYFFDYDVTMMIRTLPQQVAEQLINRHLRHDIHGRVKPVEYGGYQFDYMPHKEFRVRRVGTTRWTVVSDVGQFFQKSFHNSLTKWDIGTPEERDQILRGKERRADFVEMDDETRYYNSLECLLLEQLMTEFRSVCQELGYVPRKWQGPGFLASALLQTHGVPRREDIPILGNDKFRALAQAAYYGGRFETTAAGPIRGPVYQYDINSAYPFILTKLPCLTHGTWRRVYDIPDGDIWFGQVHFDHDAPRYLYNLPIRIKGGNIVFPKEGNGVYWSWELQAARRAGTEFELSEGWVYSTNCECQWFDFVPSIYRRRLALGKTTKGYVLKLAANSVYGKIAQSIGYAPYANPVWAGLITAGCRAMLIDAYSQAPDLCYMLATDGLFMGKKLQLPISTELGEWDETIHPEGIFIVQPGIYFAGDEPKSRGVEVGRITTMRDTFDTQFRRFVESNGVDHTISVEVTNFITAKQAIARRKWQLAGIWERTTREVSFDWSSKRRSGIAFHRDSGLRTIPHSGGRNLESLPYSRQIGGGLAIADSERYTNLGLIEADRIREQPDWVEPLIGSE